MILLECKSHLLEIVCALAATRSLAYCLHCWQQEPHEQTDDGNNHKKFYKRKGSSRAIRPTHFQKTIAFFVRHFSIRKTTKKNMHVLLLKRNILTTQNLFEGYSSFVKPSRSGSFCASGAKRFRGSVLKAFTYKRRNGLSEERRSPQTAWAVCALPTERPILSLPTNTSPHHSQRRRSEGDLFRRSLAS